MDSSQITETLNQLLNQVQAAFEERVLEWKEKFSNEEPDIWIDEENIEIYRSISSQVKGVIDALHTSRDHRQAVGFVILATGYEIGYRSLPTDKELFDQWINSVIAALKDGVWDEPVVAITELNIPATVTRTLFHWNGIVTVGQLLKKLRLQGDLARIGPHYRQQLLSALKEKGYFSETTYEAETPISYSQLAPGLWQAQTVQREIFMAITAEQEKALRAKRVRPTQMPAGRFAVKISVQEEIIEDI